MVKLKCTVTAIDKGRGFISHIATVKREDAKRLNVTGGSGLLLRYRQHVFPAVIIKRNTARSFSYCFSIPIEVAKDLKKVSEFRIISRNLTRKPPKSRELDMARVLPNMTIRGVPLMIFPLGKKILVWIAKKGNRKFVLPRFLDRKKKSKLFELMGAYFCEGRHTRKSDRHHLDLLSFSNAEASEILWFTMGVENVFGITRDVWNMQILHASPSEHVKESWIHEGFDPSKIKVYKNPSVRSTIGVIIIQIYGTTIAEVFQSLMEFSKSESLKSKELALQFFRGITRGDIGVMHSHGRMTAINFSTERKEDAEFFCELSKKLGLKSSKPYFVTGKKTKKGYWSVFITGYENFRKLAEMDAFAHKIRATKFHKGFLENRNSTIHKYLATINAGADTSRKVSEKLGISIITSRWYTQTLRKEGFLKYVGIDKETGAIRNILTKRGVDELRFYETVKKRLE